MKSKIIMMIAVLFVGFVLMQSKILAAENETYSIQHETIQTIANVYYDTDNKAYLTDTASMDQSHWILEIDDKGYSLDDLKVKYQGKKAKIVYVTDNNDDADNCNDIEIISVSVNVK